MTILSDVAYDELAEVRTLAARQTPGVRVEPILGAKLWFKPRRWGGWGWTPASWEGWVVVAVSLVALLTVASVTGGGTTLFCVAAVTIALLVVCALKGTPPGGPRTREEFDRMTGR